MNVGVALSEARERAGLTREQVAQRTRIRLLQIQALEENDFFSLGEMAEVDDLVSAYARAVELNATSLLDAIHTDYANEPYGWEVTPEEIETFPEESPAEVPQRATQPTTQPLARSHLETTTTAEVAPLPTAPPAAMPLMSAPPTLDFDVIDRARADDAGSHVSLADGFLGATEPTRRSLWPVAVVVGLLAATHTGVYLFRTSRPFTPAQATGVPAISSKPESTPGTTAADTSAAPQADAARTASPPPPPVEVAPTEPAPSEPAAMTPEPSTPSPTPRIDAQTLEKARRATAMAERSVAAAEPPTASSTIAPADHAADASVSRGTSRDIGGLWSMATRVESSSVAGFAGMDLGFELRLEQSGNQIFGDGRKTAENGRSIPAQSQTPISVRGIIDGDRLTLSFSERGQRRTTDGKFLLYVNEDGTMRGRFTSTAARSTGTVEAKRPTG